MHWDSHKEVNLAKLIRGLSTKYQLFPGHAWIAQQLKRLKWLLLACLLASCSEQPAQNTHLDQQRLTDEALALAQGWLDNAAQASGFQQNKFNGSWQPTTDNHRVDLTSQARLIYVYAAAYDLSKEPKYREGAIQAADFMLDSMRQANNNHWHKYVDDQGKPVDSALYPYGYSFTIFGLAHAYRISAEQRFIQAAMATWRSGVWKGLEAARAFSATGIAPQLPAKGVWSQNSFMHLFEALLVLHQISNSPQVWSDIESMAMFVKDHLIQPCQCLPEWYHGDNYQPLAKGGNTGIYHGHQVEWAYLLSRAVQQGLDRRYLGTAQRLLNFAITYGLDPDTGGLKAIANMKGEPLNDSYWWWSQAELLRASVHFARHYQRDDLWPIYQAQHLFARIHYIDQQRGGWNGQSPLHSNKPTSELNKVIGYHAMGFYHEALQTLK